MLPGLLAIFALLLLAGDLAVQAFEFLLGLAIVAWVRNLLAVGVGVEDLQTHVDADHAASLDMFTLSFGLDTELDRIPICAT